MGEVKSMIDKFKETAFSYFFIILILLVLSLFLLWPGLDMIILGAVFAYLVLPLSNKLEGYVKYKSVAIILGMCILIVPLLIIIFLGFQQVIAVAYDLFGSIDVSVSGNLNTTDLFTPYLNQLVQQYFPGNEQSLIRPLLEGLNDIIMEILKMLVQYIVELVQSIPFLTLQIFILFVSTFYFARDGTKMINYLQDLIPDYRKTFFNHLFQETDTVIKSVFLGHFLTAIIIGIMGGIGYFVLGYPYALLLGLITGILQLIPIIGPWPVYWVLVIADVLSGNYIRAVIVLFFGFFLSGIDVYLRPQLAGKYADLPSLILLFGFIFGPLVFGFVGLILGPIILGITYVSIKAYHAEVAATNKKED